jgi:hypothetical protein
LFIETFFQFSNSSIGYKPIKAFQIKGLKHGRPSGIPFNNILFIIFSENPSLLIKLLKLSMIFECSFFEFLSKNSFTWVITCFRRGSFSYIILKDKSSKSSLIWGNSFPLERISKESIFLPFSLN